MSFLMGNQSAAPQTNAQSTPKYTQMNVQSSAYGLPIAIAYGTTRLGDNLGWYQNFRSVTTTQPDSGGGGGGGGGKFGGGGVSGSSGGTSTTEYFADILCLICEGPVAGIPSSWKAQSQLAGTPGFDIFDGAVAQAVWDYLSANYPTEADPYSGVTFAGGANFDLGTSNNLPNFNWEVQAFFQGTAPSTYGGNGCVVGGDADPSLVVPDLLSNPQYGAGFPASRIGQVASNDEAHAVPGSGPYTITVTNHAGFIYNINVVDTIVGGVGTNLYTCVAGSPGPLQYSFNPATGVYTFNAAQAGVTVNIRYASIGALSTYQAWCLASGLWISPTYTEQSSASSMLDDIAIATFSEFVWSSGVLTVVPRGTGAVSGNGYTYTPPSSPLFALGVDDFMPNVSASGAAVAVSTDDPVIVSRSRMSDQINDIKIEALDRANQYAPTVVQATDQGLIDTFGRRAQASKSLHMFCDVGAANISAQLQLQDQNIRNNYSITLDQRYGVLDPMDLVTLTDPNYPGLSGIAVRVLEMTENDDGTISIATEEYPGNVGVAAAYNLNIGTGYVPNYNVDPGSVNTPQIFAAPVALAGNQGLEIWAPVSGSNPTLYGGCKVYGSSDPSGPYQLLGGLSGASRMGVSTAAFPAGSDPDQFNTLSVDLTESNATLASGTQSDADQANTLCLVRGANGDEYVSYETATLTATGNYDLGTYLRRGLYSTTVVDHPVGSAFVRLDPVIFKIPYQASQIGRTLYLKFAAFNKWGGGTESLSDAVAYPVLIPAPPPPKQVDDFTAQINGNVVLLDWADIPDNPAITGYDILYGPVSGSVLTAILLTEASRATSETTIAVPPGKWVLYLRARDIAGQTGPAVTQTVTVENPNDIISSIQQAPDWLGVKSGFLLHYTGVLVPDSTALAAGISTADLFTMFIPSPVPNPSYTCTAVDTTFDDTARVWFSYAQLPEAGADMFVPFSTFLDSWLSASSDSNVFAPWSIGYATGRYFKGRITEITDGSAYLLLAEVEQAPDWLGVKSGFLLHYTGVLVPDSTALANGLSNAALFTQFCPSPVANPSYASLTVDIGIATNARASFVTSELGSSSAPLSTFLDAWSAGSDPNSFAPWMQAFVTARFFRGKFSQNTSTPAAVTSFAIVLDEPPGTVTSVAAPLASLIMNIDLPVVTENANNVPVGIGGTTVNFAALGMGPFHAAPNIQVTPSDGVGTGAGASSITKTGAFIQEFSGSSLIAGNVNLIVRGA